MRKRFRFLIALVLFSAFLYFNNASWLVSTSDSRSGPVLLAHRGVHQTFDLDGVDAQTCTARRIHTPTHDFIENTLPSMRAAFEAGADIVELDIHPTTDGHFAVFHDWTLDCRTDGQGVTREQSLADLKTLDIGYGYTADNGETYPLRGKGVRLMPSLREVLGTFPDRNFLIHVKGNDAGEADRLAALLSQFKETRSKEHRSRLMVYGGARPVERMGELMPDVPSFTGKKVKDCLIGYEAYGWTGIVPEACRETRLLVPINYAPYLWGWPRRFLARMEAAGTQVFLLGPRQSGDRFTRGVDDISLLNRLPEEYAGGIWTNRIEVVGRELKPGK